MVTTQIVFQARWRRPGGIWYDRNFDTREEAADFIREKSGKLAKGSTLKLVECDMASGQETLHFTHVA